MFAMGTTVRITVLHQDPNRAEHAIYAAFRALKKLEHLFSIYLPDSQVSQFNREGHLDDPHPDFLRILRKSTYWSIQTVGAFDITVQPLWNLYQKVTRTGHFPDDDLIHSTRSSVGWNQLSLSSGGIAWRQNPSSITLNGIAQGYAADRIDAILRHHGMEHAMIDCGEIRPMGLNAHSKRWSVGVRHPRKPETCITSLQHDGRALATSGDYATTFSRDFRHHHLFDPSSGRSPQELASVTVAAPFASDADALSTGLFVLGSQRGLKLLARFKDIDAYMISKNGKVIVTRGFPIAV
jgi:FAD:protein FMN transferase